MRKRRLGLVGFASALVVSSGLMLGADTRAQSEAPHPAHLHVGTCEEPGEVVFPLNDISSDYLAEGTPMAMDMVGAESAIPVEVSVSTVDASLTDIAEGGHVLMVHESAENIGNYIACGDVGGMLLGDGELPFGVMELNGSGHSGAAWLEDNGDDTTTVTVALTSGTGSGASDGATPVADDAAGDAADDAGDDAASADATMVMIENFAYNPNPIEVAAGTTISFMNMDTAPHTVTEVGGGFNSGRIDQGGTWEMTFDEPGTYEIFCEFHPNMTATIVVS